MEEFQLDFLGIGTIKSGTSLLADMLMQHPQVQWASQKELNYFNEFQADGSPNPYHLLEMSYYRQFFPGERGQNVKWGEFSPVYISDATGMDTIKSLYPQLQLIVSLRDPVRRAHSHYLYARDFLQIIPPEIDFEQAFDRFPWLRTIGMYASQLERMFALFPQNQCLILIFEEMVRDPAKTAKTLYRHIGVDDQFTPDIQAINARKQVRFHFIENAINALSGFKSVLGESAVKSFYNSPLYPVLLKLKHNIRDKNVKPGDDTPLSPEMYVRIYEAYLDDIDKVRNLLHRGSELWPTVRKD